jgi:hypothetical protein
MEAPAPPLAPPLPTLFIDTSEVSEVSLPASLPACEK